MMPTSGVIELADEWRWEVGDGDLIGGTLSLTEGREASSLSWTLADPNHELANDLPLVVVEDVPAERATMDVTFVAVLGRSDAAYVPEGTEVVPNILQGVERDRARFRTDEALGPEDFDQPDFNTLRQARATVTATAVDPGPESNIAGGPLANQPADLELVEPIDAIDRVYNKAPATGGRDAGERGTRVPVDCWLGPPDTSAPPKVFSGYLSQLTPSAPPARLELMAVDRSAQMRRKQRARSFESTNVDDIVRRVARANDFDVDLSNAQLAEVQLTRHVQHGTTDWRFLNRILESVGHRVKVRGGTLYVTRVGKVRDDPETPVLTPDRTSSFNFAVDELTKHTTPNVTALSGADASEHRDGTSAKTRQTQLERVGVSSDYADAPSSIDQQEAKQLQAEARQHRVFTASIEATGFYPRLDTDDMVVLDGFGRRFDGPWWIDSLTHDFAGTTSFELTSNADE